MTAGNSLCFIIAFRILEISIILKLNEEKNISPPFYRFLKYFVFTSIRSSPHNSGKSMIDLPLFRTAHLMAFFTFGKIGSILKYKQWRAAIVSVSRL